MPRTPVFMRIALSLTTVACSAPLLAMNEPWVHAASQLEPAVPAGIGACSKPAAFTLPDASYPICFSTGEFYTSSVDLTIQGRGMNFTWARVYGSRAAETTAQGRGWDYCYNIWIAPSGGDLAVHSGWGRTTSYHLQADGSYAAPGHPRRITFDINTGTNVLEFPDSGRWHFRPIDASPASGKIRLITDRNGNSMSFDYDAAGKLTVVHDTLGRAITITYTAAGMIESVTDPIGRQIRYTYSPQNDLLSARSPVVTGTITQNNFPNGKATSYTYSSGSGIPALNGNLLTIRDPKGNIVVSNTYHPVPNPADQNFDRVIRHIGGEPGNILDVVYVPVAGGGVKAILNGFLGHIKEFTYNALGEGIVFDEFTGSTDPALPTTEVANRPTGRLRASDPVAYRTVCEYANPDFLLTRVVYPDLNEERFVFDAINIDRRAQGNLLERRRIAGPLGGDQSELVETMEYQPGQGGCCGADFVTRLIDTRGFESTFTYDTSGNRLSATYPVPGMQENWEHNAFGQVTKHILADNGAGCRRVDRYDYYTAGPGTGFLERVIVDATDPAACPGSHLNLTTTFIYDAVGNILITTQPGGASEIVDYNQLNQPVRHRSAVSNGGARNETLYYYDANDNHVRTDVEDRDEAGVRPAGNTHFSTITDYGLRNEQLRVAMESGATNLAPTVLTTAQIPAPDRTQFVFNEFAYDGDLNRTQTRFGVAVAGSQPFNTLTAVRDERGLIYRKIQANGAAGPGLQNTTQYDYNGSGDVVRETAGLEGDPRETVSLFDGFGRRVRETDPMGNVTEYHYNAAGDLGGNRTENPAVRNPFAVRRSGELLDVPGSAGNVRLSEMTYAYDQAGRRVREDVRHFDTQTQAAIGDGLATTMTTYSGMSQVLTVRDDNASVTTTAYDTGGRVRSVTDSRGNATVYTVDADGDMIRVETRNRSDLGAPDQVFRVDFEIDSLGREVTSTDSAGNIRRTAYDSRGDVVLTTDASGFRTRTTFDGIQRQIRTAVDMNANGVFTDPADIITTQVWDESSRLVSRTDDGGGTTVYCRDEQDRLTCVTSADGGSDSYVLNHHGDALRTEDANGSLTFFLYDKLGRLVACEIRPAEGVLGVTAESLAFDGLGRIVRAQNDDSLVTRGSVSTSGYDSLGRVIRETQQVLPSGPARTVASSYDGLGMMTRLDYPSGRTVLTGYDVINRPFVVVDGQSGTEIAHYFYSGPRVLRVDRANGTRTDFTYDGLVGQANPPGDFGAGKLVRTRHTVIASGAVIDDRAYTWSRENSKTSRRDLRAAGPQLLHTLTLDDSRRLARTLVVDGSASLVRDEQYTLDGRGNRLAVTGGPAPGLYTMDAAIPHPADAPVNQYTQTPMDRRNYDRAGNLITITPACPADFNGDDFIDFFDFGDFVTAFEAGDPPADFNGDGFIDFFDFGDFVLAFETGCGAMGEAITISYDYRHRMVRHSVVGGETSAVMTLKYDFFGRRLETVTDGGSGGGITVRRHYFDRWQEIEDQDGAGNVVSTSVYAIAIDNLVQLRRDGMDYYAHVDDVQSVMAMTNAAGAVVERYEFGDFGRPHFFTGTGAPIAASAIGNRVLFTGRPFDTPTGWYDYRTRLLDPAAGRFTTRDNLGTWGDAIAMGNAFTYGGNDPGTRTDPSGQGDPCHNRCGFAHPFNKDRREECIRNCPAASGGGGQGNFSGQGSASGCRSGCWLVHLLNAPARNRCLDGCPPVGYNAPPTKPPPDPGKSCRKSCNKAYLLAPRKNDECKSKCAGWSRDQCYHACDRRRNQGQLGAFVILGLGGSLISIQVPPVTVLFISFYAQMYTALDDAHESCIKNCDDL